MTESSLHTGPEKPRKRFYAVIDFEATCWQGEERRGDAEIIQIGCVKVGMTTRRIIDEFSSYVRPIRYPRLSDYCTRLTGITQHDVDIAPTFVEMLAEFVAWMGRPEEFTFCSWGAYDSFLLRQACRFHRVDYPFDDEYLNIKPIFSEIVSGRGVSLERALEMLGMSFEGRLHSGIDDARNVARVWQTILRGVV